MEITWSEISDHLGAIAFNASLVALVAGGGGLSLFRDHLFTSETAETQQKTLRAVLQTKVADAHRRILNWHMKIIVEPPSSKNEVTSALDPVDDYTNEIFRSSTLLRRAERLCHKARHIRLCIFICTVAALVGFLLALAIQAFRPFFSLLAIVLLTVEVWAVIRSRACKKEMDGVNEAT